MCFETKRSERFSDPRKNWTFLSRLKVEYIATMFWGQLCVYIMYNAVCTGLEPVNPMRDRHVF